MARIIDQKFYPFARGDMTTGTQYSTAVTGAGDTYTAVETAYITVPEELGRVLEYEFYLVGEFGSSASTEGVNFKWQARNFGDATWVDICPAVTMAAPTTGYTSATRKGLVAVQTNLTRPSIEVRSVIKSAATGAETAQGRTTSTSYVRIVYEA